MKHLNGVFVVTETGRQGTNDNPGYASLGYMRFFDDDGAPLAESAEILSGKPSCEIVYEATCGAMDLPRLRNTSPGSGAMWQIGDAIFSIPITISHVVRYREIVKL